MGLSNKFKIELDIGYLNLTGTKYIFESKSNDLRIISISSGIRVYVGGGFSTVVNSAQVLEIFGGDGIAINKTLTFEFDNVDKVGTMYVDGVGASTYAFNSTFSAYNSGALMFLAAYATTSTPGDTSGSGTVAAGTKIGNVRYYTDNGSGYIKIRSMYQPTTGTTITETVSAQNGTLRGGTDGIVDWEAEPNLVAPMIGAPILASKKGGALVSKILGKYGAASPSTIEYRLMKGAVELIAPAAVESFVDGIYTIPATATADTSVHFEVRIDGGSWVVGSAFDIGPVYALIGDDQLGVAGTRSSDTVTNNVHYKNDISWNLTSGGNTLTGAAIAGAANLIGVDQNSPSGFVNATENNTQLAQWSGQGGTRHWKDNFYKVPKNNVTAVIFCAGYWDASAPTYAQRSEANVTTVLDFTQRTFEVDVVSMQTPRIVSESVPTPDTFKVLWESNKASTDTQSYLGLVSTQGLVVDGVDNMTLSDADLSTALKRCVKVSEFIETGGTYYKGPSIISAVGTGTNIVLTLDTAGTDYTALTPTTGLGGFRIGDGSNAIASSSSNGTNVITLTATTVPTFDVDTVEFAVWSGNAAGDQVNAFSGFPKVDSVVPFDVEPIYTPIVISESSASITEVMSSTDPSGTTTPILNTEIAAYGQTLDGVSSAYEVSTTDGTTGALALDDPAWTSGNWIISFRDTATGTKLGVNTATVA